MRDVLQDVFVNNYFLTDVNSVNVYLFLFCLFIYKSNDTGQIAGGYQR